MRFQIAPGVIGVTPPMTMAHFGPAVKTDDVLYLRALAYIADEVGPGAEEDVARLRSIADRLEQSQRDHERLVQEAAARGRVEGMLQKSRGAGSILLNEADVHALWKAAKAEARRELSRG